MSRNRVASLSAHFRLHVAFEDTYVREDLEQASATLRELEAADAQETEEREIIRLRNQGSKQRRAQQTVNQEWDLDQPHTARVENFVKQKKELITQQRAVRPKCPGHRWHTLLTLRSPAQERGRIITALNAHNNRLITERLDKERHQRDLKAAAEKKRNNALRSKGWTQAQYVLSFCRT